jgi:transient receptor potential cation channel subfamily C member 4
LLLGTLIEAAKSGSVSRFIGRSRSEDSVCNSPNNRNESASHSNSPNSDEAVTDSPTDSNPSIDRPDAHHLSHHPSEQQRSTNSNVHNPQSNSNNNKKEHHHLHMHLNFGALAALKRKRKKFSNSRNETPVLEPPPENENASPASSLKKSIKKVNTVFIDIICRIAWFHFVSFCDSHVTRN